MFFDISAHAHVVGSPLDVSPASVDLGDVAGGAPATTVTVSIHNHTTTDLNFIGVSLVGAPLGATVTPGGFSVSAGQTITVNFVVTFPAGAVEGDYNFSIELRK